MQNKQYFINFWPRFDYMYRYVFIALVRFKVIIINYICLYFYIQFSLNLIKYNYLVVDRLEKKNSPLSNTNIKK